MIELKTLMEEKEVRVISKIVDNKVISEWYCR
jgi:hypothetical protein